MNHTPSKDWAYRIIRDYESGEYEYHCGYLLACKAVGQEPKKREHKTYQDRKQVASGDHA